MKPDMTKIKIQGTMELKVVDGTITMMMDEYKHRLREGSKQVRNFVQREQDTAV
jgi:hypothetical protein